MIIVLQRVLESSVVVSGETVASGGAGLLLLLGVEKGDDEQDAVLLAEKILKMRIFEDENEKMNLSLAQVDGEVLVVSQFTLCADVSHGRRPSFINSAPPAEANELYEKFCEELRNLGVSKVAQGVFGAEMAVELLNDGPVTIIMNTDEWKKVK